MNKIVLVAVEQLTGSTQGKDGERGEKVVVEPGVELTKVIAKSLGLGEEDIKRLLKTGAIAEQEVRVAEEGIDAFAAAEIVALTKRLEDTQGELSTALGRVTEMEGKLTAAETRATEAEGKVTAAETRATEAEGKVTAAETRATEAEGKLAAAEAKLAAKAPKTGGTGN